MVNVPWLSIVNTLLVVASVAGGIIAFRYTRKQDMSKSTIERIRLLIVEILSPVREKAELTAHEIQDFDKRVSPALAEASSDIRHMSDKIGVLETKIEVFWRNVAFDAAHILHSPHPERAELDHLLEEFAAERLTTEQMNRLREMLTEVMTGVVTGFLAGDRVAAAIILRVIEQRINA